MASGYPISVVAGRRRFMEKIANGKVIHAGTMNSGNPSVAAAQSTLRVLEDQAIHPRLFDLGRRLMEGLRDASKRAGTPLLVQGPGPMFHTGFTALESVRDFRETLTYDKPRYGAFVAGMQEHGIRLIGRGLWYVSAAHTTQEIDHGIQTAFDVLKRQ
jgi:glutamate-1-semialdehyde 2,1-aminomutase